MGERRSALFRGRHFRDEVIVLCLRWYLQYPLSYRDLEETMGERGVAIDHSTIARSVLRYAPVFNERIWSEIRDRPGPCGSGPAVDPRVGNVARNVSQARIFGRRSVIHQRDRERPIAVDLLQHRASGIAQCAVSRWIAGEAGRQDEPPECGFGLRPVVAVRGGVENGGFRPPEIVSVLRVERRDGRLENLLERAAASTVVSSDELQMVHRNAMRLLRLVNTLLDLTRIEAGGI
jgi:hypothetical protein